MPKEPTHILFARSLLGQDHLLPELKKNLAESEAYFVGAILPDAFYYSTISEASRFASLLHGHDPNIKGGPPRFVKSLLEQAKTSTDPIELALGLGLATHLILDAAFHPLVDQISGDYDDPDPVKRQSARYLHRLLETKVDQILAPGIHLPRCPVTSPTAKSLTRLGEKLGWDGPSARRALNQQRLANSLFQSRPGFLLAKALQGLGLIDRSILGLFPDQLTSDPITINAIWNSQSLDGRPMDQAFEQAWSLAKINGGRFLSAAWSFVQGKTSAVEFEQSLTQRMFKQLKFGDT